MQKNKKKAFFAWKMFIFQNITRNKYWYSISVNFKTYSRVNTELGEFIIITMLSQRL